MAKRAAFFTLGCKVNQNDAEGLKQLFRSRGYDIVGFQEVADVYVVHTCTVTHLADRKSRQVIRRAAKNNPQALVVASGCYAQVAPDEVGEIEGVDLIVGTRERTRMVELVEEAVLERGTSLVTKMEEGEIFEELPTPVTSRTRAYLKVQEGCNQFCSYCIVPYARGPVRSRRPESACGEAFRLVEAGYREIVLTGIHLGSYGQDLPGKIDLNYLVRLLITVPGLRRLRISSLDPHEFTPQIIETFTSSEVVCPHFHIPLQSGDNWILERMGRHYTVKEYLELVGKLRASRPGVALTTDVIVGFPGETDERYLHTREFIETVEFSDLHIFKYSPRQGTPAADFPGQVEPETKEARSKELNRLGLQLKERYARKFRGQLMAVLVERQEDSHADGHTPNYLRVTFQSRQDLVGEIRTVELGDYNKGYLEGKLVKTET